MARCLEGLGHEIIVADPTLAPMSAARSRKIKTDRREARALAEVCGLGAYRPAHRLAEGRVPGLPLRPPAALAGPASDALSFGRAAGGVPHAASGRTGRGGGNAETWVESPTLGDRWRHHHRRQRHGNRNRTRGPGGHPRGVPPGRAGRRPHAGGHGARPNAGQEVRGAARRADLAPESGGPGVDVQLHAARSA